MLDAVKPGPPIVVLLACALLCGQLIARVHDVVHFGVPSAHAAVHVERGFAPGHGHEHGPAESAGERAERACSLPDGALSGAAPTPDAPAVRTDPAVTVACAPALVLAAAAGAATPPRARDPPVAS